MTRMGSWALSDNARVWLERQLLTSLVEEHLAVLP